MAIHKGLAFSGGKDSWACLWLEPDLSQVTVIWVNTGKNYPELLATVEKARALCPRFVEVKTDRDGQNAREGLPADVVPIRWTRFGQLISGPKAVTVQSYLGCCHDNISGPLHAKARELGITHLVRGQRLDETHKSPARNGEMVEGITYLQPIEHWTKRQVLDFLKTKMSLPEHFRFRHSSMDCYDCTAYRQESKDRIDYARKRHPALHAEYRERVEKIDAALLTAMRA